MPIYDYKCKKCSKSFAKFLPVSEYQAEQKCKCGGDTKKLLTPILVVGANSGNRLGWEE